jgi:hypothetical protein
MRKLLALVLLLVGVSFPAQANTPTVAIIDVGFNASLFPNNVVAEVCIVSVALCPNGQRFQEGAGAASVSANALPAFAHGTTMLSILTSVNPDAKVVLIRVLGMNTNGRAGAYTIDDITTALRWIVNNSSRLNIKAVSISQGRVNAPCRATPELTGAISSLKQQEVAVIASTGNEKNRTNIAVPACIDDVISVGATDNPVVRGNEAWDRAATPTIALYSNGNASTDFYTNGRFFHTAMNGTRQFAVGTSNATAAFAGWWMKNLKPTISETYSSITTTTTSNQWLTGRYVLIP